MTLEDIGQSMRVRIPRQGEGFELGGMFYVQRRVALRFGTDRAQYDSEGDMVYEWIVLGEKPEDTSDYAYDHPATLAAIYSRSTRFHGVRGEGYDYWKKWANNLGDGIDVRRYAGSPAGDWFMIRGTSFSELATGKRRYYDPENLADLASPQMMNMLWHVTEKAHKNKNLWRKPTKKA